MASGKDTPQYKAVQKSIEVITHHLVVSEDAKEDLRLKYIKHNWLAKHARPEASALVVMALGRIELDVKEYEEFIAILKDIAGMGQIVGILIDACPITPRTDPSKGPVGGAGPARPAEEIHVEGPTQPEGSKSKEHVQDKIEIFERRFNNLKDDTRTCLEKCFVTVKKIADVLTSLPADDMDEHKQFLESHLTALYQAPNHSELFGVMNFYWNYLSYHLLDYLIKEFKLLALRSKTEIYKQDLKVFRIHTPLTVFCESQKKKHTKPPKEFSEVVAEFEWPEHVTLEVVEQFRQEYASHYRLRECAMMLIVVRRGCFAVSWFIPNSIVKKLKFNVPAEILSKFSITILKINGDPVYNYENSKHRSPLLLIKTVCDQDVETLKILIEKGADLNASAFMTEFTPLIQASRMGNTEILQILLENGADPDLTFEGSWTALMAATRNGHYGAVDLLLQHGANLDKQDDTGWSVVMAAVHNNHEDIALRLIEAGPTPDIQDNNKTNAILLAIANEQYKAAHALLHCKPTPALDIEDRYGETALSIASKKKNTALVQTILGIKADPTE